MCSEGCLCRREIGNDGNVILLQPTNEFSRTAIFAFTLRICEKTFPKCIFVNDVRPKRRKNNQVQRIVKRPAGVEREGRSEAEERPNEARRAARRGEIIAR